MCKWNDCRANYNLIKRIIMIDDEKSIIHLIGD